MALTHDDNGEPTAADAEEISEFSEAVVSVCRRVQHYLATYEEGQERILEAVSKSLSILVDLDAGMQSGYVTTVVSRADEEGPG